MSPRLDHAVPVEVEAIREAEGRTTSARVTFVTPISDAREIGALLFQSCSLRIDPLPGPTIAKEPQPAEANLKIPVDGEPSHGAMREAWHQAPGRGPYGVDGDATSDRAARSAGVVVTAREVIAYAITHAPRGQKGGPYEGPGQTGAQVPTLHEAYRRKVDKPLPETLRAIRKVHPHARVIRIVRARPTQQPSEASAVAVLRELVAWDDRLVGKGDVYAIVDRARSVLAAAGPDPMPVVRAAMRETEAEDAFDRVAAKGQSMNAAADAICAARANRVEAVGKFRKAGGK